jgi:hypothetical protein
MFRGSNTRNVAGAVVAILLIGPPVRTIGAQSTWDRYTPGTLTAVIRESEADIRSALATVPNPDKRPSEHFLGDDHATVATAIYMGESRPIDPIRSELIAAWGRSRMRDSSMAASFHREYRFQEGDRVLWLPVQDRVAGFFPKELRAGQQVKLYVMLLGGYYARGEITWAFIVNEFRAVPLSAKP